MLSTCLSRCARVGSPSFLQTRSLHASTTLCAETSRKHISRSIKKNNNINKEERWRKASESRPSVVLGTRPGEESKWEECDLAKILVNTTELNSPPELHPIQEPVGTVYVPTQLGFGVGAVEQQMLLHDLPTLSAQSSTYAASRQAFQPTIVQQHAEAEKRELLKANVFAKMLDLRNANAGGISYENRRRIIVAFSDEANSFDPGRTEVQAALLTYKIRNLWSHLTKFKRDVGNRRGLRKLVHQRAKILKYLKGLDRDRYDTLLPRLALEPESVEGELVV